jgi:hypothetical protein
MEPARFQITADAMSGRVVVNDVDVTDRVSALQVNVGEGPTVLTLVSRPSKGTIEGEGIVQVQPPGDGRTDAEIICEFLDQVDPALLDSDSLNARDVSQGLTPVILQVLATYARGETWDPT